MVVVATVVVVILVLSVALIVALHRFNFLDLRVGRDMDLAIKKSFRGG